MILGHREEVSSQGGDLAHQGRKQLRTTLGVCHKQPTTLLHVKRVILMETIPTLVMERYARIPRKSISQSHQHALN